MLPYLVSRQEYQEILAQIKQKGDLFLINLPYFAKVRDWWFSLEEEEIENKLRELDPNVQCILNFLIPQFEREVLEYCYEVK